MLSGAVGLRIPLGLGAFALSGTVGGRIPLGHRAFALPGTVRGRIPSCPPPGFRYWLLVSFCTWLPLLPTVSAHAQCLTAQTRGGGVKLCTVCETVRGCAVLQANHLSWGVCRWSVQRSGIKAEARTRRREKILRPRAGGQPRSCTGHRHTPARGIRPSAYASAKYQSSHATRRVTPANATKSIAARAYSTLATA